MTIKIADVYCIVNDKGIVYCSYKSLQRNAINEEILKKFRAEIIEVHCVLYHLDCNPLEQEFMFSLKAKIH